MRARALLGWTVATLGCVGSAPPPRPAHPVASEVGARVEILPSGGAWFAGSEPDGALDVVAGGLRVRALDDDLRLADDRFARPIVRAVRVARGWVFVADDGACAASATFLGPLRRVGNLPGFRRTPRDRWGDGQSGRVGLVDREGSGWTSDGGDFARVGSLPDVALRNLLFLDEAQGLAVTDAGALLRTLDGGASWRSVQAQGYGTYSVTIRDGRFTYRRDLPMYFLYGADGFAEVADDGPAIAPPPWDERLFAWRLVAREPRWVDLLDGEVVGDRIRVREYVPGAEVDVRTGRQGPLPSGREADPEHRVEVAYVESGGDPDAPARGPQRPDPRAIMDTVAGGSHRLTLSRDVGAVHGVAGECALVSLVPEGLGCVPLGTGRTEDLPVSVLVESGRVVEAGVNPDGVVTALLGSGDGEGRPRSYAVGATGGPLVARDLPPGLDHVAFADARRGLAWSGSPLRVARTLDGGATWRDVPLPVDGRQVASPVTRDDEDEEYDEYEVGRPRASDDPWRAVPERCTRDRCLVGRALVVWGWGAFGAVARPALAVR